MEPKTLHIIVLALAGVFSTPANAQSQQAQTEERQSPIEVIESGAEDRIKIEIPDFILDLVVNMQDDKVKGKNGPVLRPGVNRTNGYRIQVFSDGRSPHSLEARAKARGSAIVARLPKYRGQVYTFSSAPNWYTRVGNFATSQEASAALAELKRMFPQYASEMRVVKSQVVIIK